jgi:hypothetical protein
MWKMYFDGEYSKGGVGYGVFLVPPNKKEIHLSYNLEFEATHNVARKMHIIERVIFGDSEIVVQQMKSY